MCLRSNQYRGHRVVYKDELSETYVGAPSIASFAEADWVAEEGFPRVPRAAPELRCSAGRTEQSKMTRASALQGVGV